MDNHIAEHVYVVDDEPKIQTVVRKTLERAGLTVSCFGSADDCLACLDTGACDLLITDVAQLLRVLADRDPLPAKFLILGSASPDIIRQSSETLAGRIEFIYMSGFDLEEVGAANLTPLWHRGGFPLSYLAETDEDSAIWREQFIHTFLERDLRNFGIESPPAQLRRFWTMLAHAHGQIWNASQLAMPSTMHWEWVAPSSRVRPRRRFRPARVGPIHGRRQAPPLQPRGLP